MKYSRIPAAALVMAAIFLLGCSGGSSPVTPDVRNPQNPPTGDAHQLLGLYTLVCDPEAQTLDIITLRDAELHMNALKFLEPPPNFRLRIEGPIKIMGTVLTVNFGITHPFLGLFEYTGFDVCGIIFTHGSYTGFYDPDIVMAGPGDMHMLNADGYSRWWNPAEFPHGVTIFNYIEGLLGTPSTMADYNCTVNGYKYFADTLEFNEPVSGMDPAYRGMFSPGQHHSRQYIIDMGGGLIFNYAIDACWKKPLGSFPYHPPDCFPPGANRPEAYNAIITEIYNTLFYEESTGLCGGNLKLQIDVWDHFDCALNQVWGESLDGLEHVVMAAPISGNEIYSTYELDFYGGYLEHGGFADILITAESEVMGYGNILPDKPLCAYFTHRTLISPIAPEYPDGWARTYGGSGDDRGYGVVCDSGRNVYVAGYFYGPTDFDPSDDGEFILNGIGGRDVCLSKFNTYGDFLWAKAWGSTGSDWGYSVGADSLDNIYVCGDFSGTCDFDPGPGVEQLSAIGGTDAFLSIFDADGNFRGVRTWGGTNSEQGYAIWVDNANNIYLGGYFNGTADLDPGPGVDEHVSSGGSDAYIIKLDSNCNHVWARHWGGPAGDQVYAIVVNQYGDVYSTGRFGGTADFDPGIGVVELVSHGGTDAFITKLNASGDFQWAGGWGSTGGDLGEGITLGADGYPYVGGDYYYTVDFDPGPGVDNQPGFGSMDIFLTKFSPSGEHLWARTWGTSGSDDCHRLSIRGGNVFIVGHFTGTMDFDPSPEGEDIKSTNGSADFFISKFNPYGDYLWSRTWGGTSGDYCRCVCSDNIGNLFIVGGFGATADFDPGPGEDWHAANGSRDIFLIKMLPNGYW